MTEQLEQAIQLAQGSDFFNYVFYMNQSRPPFNDPAVRQAIAQSIDTKTLVETVLLGQGTELPLSYYHPDLPWAINTPHQFDPEAAKASLDAAGLTDSDGDGIREFEGAPLDYEILCDANNPVEVRSTELIIGWLKDVGIPATARCMDIDTEVTYIWPNFVSVAEPDYDMAIFGWSSGTQAQRGFIQYLTSGDFLWAEFFQQPCQIVRCLLFRQPSLRFSFRCDLQPRLPPIIGIRNTHDPSTFHQPLH